MLSTLPARAHEAMRPKRVGPSKIALVVIGAAAATCVLPATGQAAVGHHHTTPQSRHHSARVSKRMARDLAKLRSCESGGNWHADTGNGYYGAYQFAEQTWSGLGYSGRPDNAQPSVQNQATIKLHSQRGWHPWPSCARKEGLH